MKINLGKIIKLVITHGPAVVSVVAPVVAAIKTELKKPKKEV